MVSENVYQFDCPFSVRPSSISLIYWDLVIVYLTDFSIQFNPDYAELYPQPQFCWSPDISKTPNNNHDEHDGEGVTYPQL